MIVYIHTGNSLPYEVTELDRLWLLRAVEAEGEPREYVARALINLFAWARENGKAIGESLTKTVRAYAQPVNPDWFPGGAKVPWSADKEVLQRAAMRRDIHSMRMSFSPDTREAVEKALSSSWHEDWTDYAAPGVTHKSYQRRSADVKGKNTFWTRAPGWGGYEIRIEQADTLPQIEIPYPLEIPSPLPKPSPIRSFSHRAMTNAQKVPWWVWVVIALSTGLRIMYGENLPDLPFP